MSKYAVNGKEPIAAWIPSLDSAGNGTTTLTDLVGSNNGTLANMDAATDWVLSDSKYALDFDGTNDAVVIGTGATLSTPAEMAFAAWVRPISTAGVDVVAANSDAEVVQLQWALEFNRTANKFSILANAAAVALTSTTAITQNNWYHVMFTRSGSAGAWTYRFFLNGQLDGQNTTVQNPGSHSTVAIARYGAFTGGFTFRGLIDDTRLFGQSLVLADAEYLAQQRGVTKSGGIIPILRQHYAAQGAR
jgi:hypothetical protein